MNIYKKAILPAGFKASAVASGIKKSGKLDLALFYSAVPAKASCLFTTNKLEAAPIVLNKRYLKNNQDYQAIIVNSGNANCFTGKPGLKDAQDSALVLAKALRLKQKSVLVASTGIIGRRLPLGKIKQAIPILAKGLSKSGIDKAKKAIMTTDTFAKEITVKFNIGNKVVTICGVAKGAGMIAPNLACPERLVVSAVEPSRGATMLCFVFSDVRITQDALDKALKDCVDNSFNCITVDGCMSTNDSVMLLANGAAGNILIDANNNFGVFIKALSIICGELAKSIVKDAEGASKFIQIKVAGAKSFNDARRLALSIANSNLFKTAMYGQNPNFGRIVSALGASGIGVKEKDIKIKVSSLKKKEIDVDVCIGQGNSSAVVYTSDLTCEYIKINANYN